MSIQGSMNQALQSIAAMGYIYTSTPEFQKKKELKELDTLIERKGTIADKEMEAYHEGKRDLSIDAENAKADVADALIGGATGSQAQERLTSFRDLMREDYQTSLWGHKRARESYAGMAEDYMRKYQMTGDKKDLLKSQHYDKLANVAMAEDERFMTSEYDKSDKSLKNLGEQIASKKGQKEVMSQRMEFLKTKKGGNR